MIAVDVGNSKTALAFFRDGDLAGRATVGTDLKRPAEGYRRILLDLLEPLRATLSEAGPLLVASVVPPATETLRTLGKELDLHVVGPASPLSYRIALPQPEAVGADRLADLEAAVRGHGAPVIAVKVGTATTLSAVNAEREFIGGAIAPGIGISLDALFARTARIRPVPLATPERAIGRTTGEAVLSGALLGHAALVEGLVARTRQEMGGPGAPVVLSGGAAGLLAPHLGRDFRPEPLLTLAGLNWIHRNLSAPRGARA